MSTRTADSKLALVSEFISLEADLLDHYEYEAWQALWIDEGHYVVPVEPEAENFEDTLNYAYDNAAMRDMRIRRLTSGESMSASHAARTLRSVSRFRILETEANGDIRARNAQVLVEYKFDRHRTFAANVEWMLRPEGDGFRILQKVVRLINGGDSLTGLTFLP